MGATALVWTLLAFGTPVQAQNPPPPPPPSAANGLIVGRVVDGSSGRPVAGAIVTLSGGSGPTLPVAPDGSTPIVIAGSNAPRALTNANGQFVFRKLTKGSYSLNATRAGYVDGAYGRRRPGGSSMTLQLDEGQRVSDVAIPMWKFAVITGTVTDEAGEPLMGVQVRAFQRRIVSGRRRLTQGPIGTTDDRGIYRISSLVPGDYVVAFVSREASVPTSVSEALRNPNTNDPKYQELSRERFTVGLGFSTLGSPSALQVGGLVRELPFGGATPPPSAEGAPLFIYPTQFFPGVSAAARAGVITLASGQERESIDFSLRPIKTARVSGTVLGPDGPAANVALRLVPTGDDMQTELETSVTMTGSAGDFTLLGVPAGQYTIKILRVPRPAVTSSSSTTMTQIQMGSTMVMTSVGPTGGPAGLPPIPDDPTMFGETPVAVADRDVNEVVVTLQRGARVTGRFEFDGALERPNGTAMSRIPVTLERVDAGSQANGPFTTVPSGRADETGVFKTYGVPPGKYTVRIGGAPSGWTVRSIMSEGRDLSDAPIDLRSTDVANVVVTFTDRPSRLTGTVRGADGNPDPGALVVVFPSDPSAWSDYGLNPRRVRSTRPSKNGSYSFTGLPPGDYYVAAFHEESVAQWQDPQALEELSRSASQIRIAEGDTRNQDVKSTGGRQ